MTLDLTGLVEDFVATRLLSKVELDFLESELWEIHQHIGEITSLTVAPDNITDELNLDSGSSWQLCCAEILDLTRPKAQSRTSQLLKLIKENPLL